MSQCVMMVPHVTEMKVSSGSVGQAIEVKNDPESH